MVDDDTQMVDGFTLMRFDRTLTVGGDTGKVDGSTLTVDNGTLMGHNQHRLGSVVTNMTR
jgi:hypothetical protein